MRQAALMRSLVFGAVCGAVLVGSWGWRHAVIKAVPPAVPKESWEHVREQFPMPPDPSEPGRLTKETVDAVLQADPFLPDRGKQPVVSGAQPGNTESGPATVETPTFAYKGRIALGQRQRAILEQLQTHKTHFLEVGQEVAGFKLLDIQDDRVILSDPQTHEEISILLSSKRKP